MDDKIKENKQNFLLYEDGNGNINVEVLLHEENVWLNTRTIAELYNVDRTVITKHINNIYKEEELNKSTTSANFAHIGNDGLQGYSTKYYNLDMIISIGFRVNSKKAIIFRL